MCPGSSGPITATSSSRLRARQILLPSARRCPTSATAIECNYCAMQWTSPDPVTIPAWRGFVTSSSRKPGRCSSTTEHLGSSSERPRLAGPTRTSAYQRLAHLPPHRLLAVFDELIDLHRFLAREGLIAGDLYDGCLILDFATGRLTVIDLDSYHRGPIVNTMGRMFGSARFMAPEEFELGATIDQRTTVYTLARLAWHFGTRLTERAEQFCGPDSVRAALEQALRPGPDERFATVGEFAAAWRATRC